MNRREFLKLTTSAAALLPAGRLHGEPSLPGEPLAAHRIATLETKSVPLPWPRHVGRNAKLDAHGNGPTVTAVVLKTDQGAVGWGEMAGSQKAVGELRERIVGKSVSHLIAPDQGIRSAELKPLDIPLHDLAAVILGVPVWKMLGAGTPQLFPVYSGMIYFDDLDPKEGPAGIDQVLKNCAADRDYGYRQFKVKIGRGHRWMSPEAGLKRDIDVVRAIADGFPECQLLVDGNDGFTPDTIIAFLKGIEGIPLVWLEEPFVENESDWRQVHDWIRANGRSNILLADGEQHNDFPLLEKLEAAGIINVRLTDILGYGFTRWRALMPRLEATGTLASPHCWGSGLKTIYTAHLCAALGNTPTIEGVTCSHEHVDFGDNLIRGGKQQVSNKPGFGLTLKPA